VIAYLECSTGISGDKFLAALIDAGFPPERLRALLEPLGIAPGQVLVERVVSRGLAATSVRLAEHAGSEPIGTSPMARNATDLRELIAAARLADPVRGGALRALDLLLAAEAHVHGVDVADVHLHEVGALDTILDIVGVAAGLAELGIDELTCSPIAVGSGTVDTAHGLMPVPTPATAQLLLGAPTTTGPQRADGGGAGELTTPTGAALLRAFATGFGNAPGMTAEKVGYGAGTRDPGFPNVARITIGRRLQASARGQDGTRGDLVGSAAGEGVTTESVVVLETNIDHLTPEQLAHVAEELMSDGALDVWQTPVVMKKGRAAVSLSVMTEPKAADALASRMHELTGTLGVRRSELSRSVLARERHTVNSRYGPVRVKVARVGGMDVRRPEHEDLARIARATGHSLLEISAHIAEDVAEGVFLE
jgi:uncharacterized protein (TIGR00299 family) protein